MVLAIISWLGYQSPTVPPTAGHLSLSDTPEFARLLAREFHARPLQVVMNDQPFEVLPQSSDESPVRVYSIRPGD